MVVNLSFGDKPAIAIGKGRLHVSHPEHSMPTCACAANACIGSCVEYQASVLCISAPMDGGTGRRNKLCLMHRPLIAVCHQLHVASKIHFKETSLADIAHLWCFEGIPWNISSGRQMLMRPDQKEQTQGRWAGSYMPCNDKAFRVSFMRQVLPALSNSCCHLHSKNIPHLVDILLDSPHAEPVI